jgi:hypothetical protein
MIFMVCCHARAINHVIPEATGQEHEMHTNPDCLVSDVCKHVMSSPLPSQLPYSMIIDRNVITIMPNVQSPLPIRGKTIKFQQDWTNLYAMICQQTKKHLLIRSVSWQIAIILQTNTMELSPS